ncbi:hypothetical protein FACS1894152_8000 [Bacilli bacterium]|nr:hypothetical protein FACS1894152_8000 [Bacilli bacterium]
MFHLTKKAYEDLKDIASYTSKTWGIGQRAIYLKMMDTAFHELSDNPQRGIKIDEIRRGYFKYRVGRHLIFYRLVSDDDVQIVRILHQTMDIESHIFES